ncbi:ROK family protein [Luteipulveratus sp. YIM 133132]|uniref:ROK family protein n=1 Tax=Luteipulveratus flavus TaxID=3031728 RepID=UPI0023AFFC9A|nr:ROK family protein [Luteipulveratus sp. YIM 133132]MDE9365388.1 ROK family protein [Luteipulveratus sp. YIM 133132]
MADVGARPVVAAFDVGGTRVKAALVDRDLDVIATVTVPTPADIAVDAGAALRPVLDTLRARAAGTTVVGAGLAVPGLVDDATGTGILSVNLGWRDQPLGDQLTAAFGLPCVVGHDVRAGLLAEQRVGAAAGAANVLFVPVGTGIAAALMVDGRVLRAGGWAGEIGHAVVDPDGHPCPCGARGCLETIASASAVARRYAERTGRPVDAADVAALVRDGDETAGEVWHAAVDALAAVLCTTLTATGIDRVIVGGGLVLSGDLLLVPLRRAVEQRMTLGRRPQIVASRLLDQAGCLGAAVLAWDAA